MATMARITGRKPRAFELLNEAEKELTECAEETTLEMEASPLAFTPAVCWQAAEHPRTS